MRVELSHDEISILVLIIGMVRGARALTDSEENLARDLFFRLMRIEELAGRTNL